MFRRRFLTAAVVAAVAVLYSAPRADAGFKLDATVVGGGSGSATINDNNVPANSASGSTLNVLDTNIGPTGVGTIETPSVSNTPALNNPLLLFTVGGVQIGLSATSNSTTSPSIASLSTTTEIVIRNTNTAAITLTLTISDDFTNPAGLGLFNLAQTLTINAFYQSNSAAAFGNGVATSDSVSSFAFASPNATSTGVVGSNTATFASSPSNALFNRTAASFNMGQTFNVLLQAGEGVKFQGTAELSSAPPPPAIPAPSGLVLLGTAVPVLGLLRRRLWRNAAPTV